MPYFRKRRFARKRRPYRKKRYVKRSRIPRAPRANTLVTKQVVTSSLVLTAEAGSSDFQSNYMDFSLDQIDPGQLTAFRKLFSEYCIKGIKVQFTSTVTNTALAGETLIFKMSLAPTTSPYGAAIDWISQSAGPDANAKTRNKWLGKYQMSHPVMTAKLVPRAAYQINNPGAVPAGLVAAKKNLWLSCLNNFGTLHSGLRIGCEWQEPHPLQELQVITTYIIAFRKVI